MVAHTLGNPFDIDAVSDFCEANGLWLVEDNCDAMGSEYTTHRRGRPRPAGPGRFGHLATSSFYPAHQMTTGEGGAVYTSDDELASIAESIRDWGRDCYCQPGRSNTCGKRFGWSLGTLPEGYDHKYTYSHFGYNLKMTDMQAAVGVAQLEKLPSFVEARRRNFDYFHKRLARFGEVLRLPEPTPNSTPSWFGFLVVVKPGNSVTRDSLVAALEARPGPDSDAVRRQPRPPALLRRDARVGHGLPADRRPGQHRPTDERRLLVRGLPGHDRGASRPHLLDHRATPGCVGVHQGVSRPRGAFARG